MNLEQAMNYLVFYNGYEEIVHSLLEHISMFSEGGTILPPKSLKYGDESETVEAILWLPLSVCSGIMGHLRGLDGLTKRKKQLRF